MELCERVIELRGDELQNAINNCKSHDALKILGKQQGYHWKWAWHKWQEKKQK